MFNSITKNSQRFILRGNKSNSKALNFEKIIAAFIFPSYTFRPHLPTIFKCIITIVFMQYSLSVYFTPVTLK